jgi:cytochrome c biogenesis protein CcdA
MDFGVIFIGGLVTMFVLIGLWLWVAMKFLRSLTKAWLERVIGKHLDERSNHYGKTWHIRGRATVQELLLVYGVNFLMTLLITVVPLLLAILFIELITRAAG